MCRLFGLYANKPVNVRFSFYSSPVSSFSELSKRNPDGWGIAWLNARRWKVFKEPLDLYSSEKAYRLIQRVYGRIMVSHIRYATHGELRRENTHPWLYKDWVFAHNGVIYDANRVEEMLGDEYRDLEGETDSEIFFHLLVQEITFKGDPVEGVRSAIGKLVGSGVYFASLNFIASDGVKLYALRYAEELPDYYTLYYIKRPTPGLELSHLSQATRQLITTKLSSGEKAVIVASEPMSDEYHWRLIPNKNLLIIDENLSTTLVDLHG